MQYVDIGTPDTTGGMDPIVRCRLLPDGTVEVTGTDSALVEELASGILDAFGRKVTPQDGLAFLHALVDVYRTPYLLSTPIRDEEVEPLS